MALSAAGADQLAADLDRYLSQAANRGLSARTLAMYRRDLEEFACFLRAERATALWMVDKPLLRRWLSALRARGLGVGSRLRRASEARAFTRFALENGPDPFEGLSLPRRAAPARRVLTREEVERLLAVGDGSAAGLRDKAVLTLLYATGLRVSQLVALDVRQVDLIEGRLLRWDAAGRPWPTFMGRVAIETLATYLQSSRPVLLRGGRDRALFVSREAKRLSARAVEHLVGRRAAEVGLRASPRDLRATCAVHLREGGATAIAVHELLGVSTSARQRTISADGR